MDFEETNTNGNCPSSDPTLDMDRKRSRIGKTEEDNKHVTTPSDVNVYLNESISGNLCGLIEETVKNCLCPVIKEMMNGTTSMMMVAMGGGAHGFCSLSFSPMFTRPLGYGVDCRRRRKQGGEG